MTEKNKSMVKNLEPKEAHDYLQQTPEALFIDCRTPAERQFVGYPLGSVPVVWSDGPDWQVNPHFVDEVREQAGEGAEKRPVVVICRSGQRSFMAGEALVRAGFKHVINVAQGFEGPLDNEGHRNNLSGWRVEGLPWEQD